MQNDFLSSLSSRAIQETRPEPAAGELKPRPLALFEPLAAPVLPGLDAIRESETALETETPHTASAQTLAASPPPSRHQRQSPAAEPTNTAQPTSPTPAPVQQAREVRPFQPSNTLEDRRISAQPALAAATLAPAEKKLPEPRTNQDRQPGEKRSGSEPQTGEPVRIISEQIIITRQELLPSQKDTLQALTASNDRRNPALIDPAPTPRPEKQAGAKIVPEQILVTHRELPPSAANEPPRLVPAAVPERKTQPNMPQNEAQPPSIQVTIGRIEIKASSPTVSPKRGSAAATTMSLDEYLRRRQGEGHQ